MNDQMRAEFETWAKAAGYALSQTTDDKYWSVATAYAWQVWQAAYAAGRWQAAYAAGRKAEREAICVQWEHADATIAEVERLRGELAAAKAASVVTDEEVAEAFEKWLEYECWECHRNICEATWQAAIRWLRWLRERTKGGEG